MKVKYAVHILSKTMTVALSTLEMPERTATAEYCEMINSFFDCLKVRSLTEGRRKTKPFLEPYVNQSEAKFTWLIENFLEYFNTWKESIETRPGKFTATAKSKCLFHTKPIKISKSLVTLQLIVLNFYYRKE